MEVLNISVDENEADTSSDELDEDPDFNGISTSPVHKKYINREGLSTSGKYSNLFKEWERPSLPEGTLLYSSSSLEAQPDSFRFLFLDSVSTVSKIRHPCISNYKYYSHWQSASLRTVIRLFGVAQLPVYSASQDLFDEPDIMNPNCFENRYAVSVCCNVHGYYSHFYALPTREILRSEKSLADVHEQLIKELNKSVSLAVLQDLNMIHYHEFIEAGSKPIVGIEFHDLGDVVNRIFHFPTIGKRDKNSLVLSIIVALPTFVPVAACELSKMKIKIPSDSSTTLTEVEFDPYENNLTNNLRFLTDQNIAGCTWLELAAGKYFHRNLDNEVLERESHCQIELDIHYEDIIKMVQQPERIPPLRVLSLDLESRVNTKKVPKGESGIARNQIIQIGAVMATYGAPGNPIIGKAAFVLGTCDTLPDTKIVQFYDQSNPADASEQCLLKHEAVMLSAFRDFVVQMDPDIITGYNIKNFDLPYLINRADKFYDSYVAVRRFPFLGRLKKVKASLRPIVNKNKRMHGFDHKIVNIQGRIVMDMYPLYYRHVIEKGPLKLKDVAKKFLKAGEEKDDVKYTEINGLQDGTPRTRSRLAKYCVQDCYLPVKLMLVHLPDKKSAPQDFIQYYFQQARLGGTIFRYLVNKSKDYNKYFKQVRVQKNNGQVKYHPDTPSPKKPIETSNTLALAATAPSPPPKSTKPSASGPYNFTKPSRAAKAKRKNCSKMLFTDDDD